MTPREEIAHAAARADFVTQRHPAVKRAERAVYRSTPNAVGELHEAYRTAGAVQADNAVIDAWRKLSSHHRDRAVTDPEFGDKVLAHLAEVHRATRVRNDPTETAETRQACAEAGDRAWRTVHSQETEAGDWRAQHTGRRMELENRARSGDAAAAVELLPPTPSDAHARLLAEAITPSVDPAYAGKRLQAARAVRDAEVEVQRTRMVNDAVARRAQARPVRDLPPNSPATEALVAESKRNAQEWQTTLNAHERARARLAEARGNLKQAEAEYQAEVEQQHAEVSRQMHEAFDALPGLPKSTEGKGIARAAGVPRTITKLAGRERELAREVNKRADVLSEGVDSSNRFNRQADIVEATHARLSGTLCQDVQDRLDALCDQARDQRGAGSTPVYRENLGDAIQRWDDFQRAKAGAPVRDEDEQIHRETLARQLEYKEPELAARIRAGNATEMLAD